MPEEPRPQFLLISMESMGKRLSALLDSTPELTSFCVPASRLDHRLRMLYRGFKVLLKLISRADGDNSKHPGQCLNDCCFIGIILYIKAAWVVSPLHWECPSVLFYIAQKRSSKYGLFRPFK